MGMILITVLARFSVTTAAIFCPSAYLWNHSFTSLKMAQECFPYCAMNLAKANPSLADLPCVAYPSEAEASSP